MSDVCLEIILGMFCTALTPILKYLLWKLFFAAKGFSTSRYDIYKRAWKEGERTGKSELELFYFMTREPILYINSLGSLVAETFVFASLSFIGIVSLISILTAIDTGIIRTIFALIVLLYSVLYASIALVMAVKLINIIKYVSQKKAEEHRGRVIQADKSEYGEENSGEVSSKKI